MEALQEESRSAKAVIEEAAVVFDHFCCGLCLWFLLAPEDQRKQEEEIAELERRVLISPSQFSITKRVKQNRKSRTLDLGDCNKCTLH